MLFKNLFWIFRIWLYNHLPIKKNRIVFLSHLGKAYSCNPRYLCEYFCDEFAGKYELIWIYDRSFERPNLPQRVIGVPFFSDKAIRMFATAKVVVSNTRISDAFAFKKRTGQMYVQMWHSSLRLKCIEKDANLNEKYVEFAKRDSRKIDVICSGAKFSSQIFKKSFWFNGLIIETGTPRIDWLRNLTEIGKEEIYRKANLKREKHYLLYAPTFRKDGNLTVYDINFYNLITNLSLKFGGEWIVLYRLHPNLRGKEKICINSDFIVDMSDYDDIQELLAISDLLITDYSSSMFDAALCGKLCVLYASDLSDYLEKERNLYFDIRTLPFPLAENNDELLRIVKSLDYEEYVHITHEFLNQLGVCENGQACKKIAEYIINQI